SAPAATSLLRQAASLDQEPSLIAALKERVVVACVGPVTAGPLERRGVPCLLPDRPRLGNLVRVVIDELPTRQSHRLRVGGRTLEVRGHAAVVDGRIAVLPPASMSVLTALARHPGRVLSRQDLLRELPG